jgi:hypothetical protein
MTTMMMMTTTTRRQRRRPDTVDHWAPRPPLPPRAPRGSHPPTHRHGRRLRLRSDVDTTIRRPPVSAPIQRISLDEKAAIGPAKKRIMTCRASRGELADDDTDEAEVNRLVDEIPHRRAVRKARLSALTRTARSCRRSSGKVDQRTH